MRPLIQWLIDQSVLQPLTPAGSYTCTECGDRARVSYLDHRPDGQSGFIHCQCGVSAVPNDALLRWGIDTPTMLQLIFRGIHLALENRVPDHLWQLGKTTWAGKSREIWFARCFRKSVGPEAKDILKGRPKAILFAPTEEGSFRWHSLVGNLTIALETTLAFNGGQIDFDLPYVETCIEGAGMGAATPPEKSTQKRGGRAANIEALTNEMIEHLRAAKDHAKATEERNGAPELLPRPTQKQLGERVGLRPDAVSRCLKDHSARELQIYWKLAGDLDELLRWTGPPSKGRKA